MKTKKIHKRVVNKDYKEVQTPYDYTHTTMCYNVREHVTFDDNEVTCKLCLWKMLERNKLVRVGDDVEIRSVYGDWCKATVQVVSGVITVSLHHTKGRMFNYEMGDTRWRRIV